MNTKYFMFCLVNFMSFVNIHPFLSFRPATHSKKSWDSKAFTIDTKWWSVSGVILSHSSCKQVLRWATVRCLRCRILRFKMCHTFSIGDRSGLQAGQSSTRTLFLRSQDFVMCAECGFALSCWNMHGCPWKRCLLEGSILCSKISMYFSALMVPSQKCKLPLPRALTQPHTMTDPGFRTCCW